MSGFDGIWETVTKTPVGNQLADITIVTDGSTLTGKSVTESESISLEEGKVEGNRATWKMSITKPFRMTLVADVTVDGDVLSGGIKAGMLGTSPISGKRKG